MKEIVKKYLSLFTNENLLNIFSESDLLYIYQCLSLGEERNSTIRDQWGNWDFQYTENNFSEPYCDLFVIKKLNQKGLRKKNIWPENKSFALAITHDVDLLTGNSTKSLIRYYQKQIKTDFKSLIKMPLIASKDIVMSYFRYLLKDKDPLWDFEIWTDLESKYNFKSTFFAFIRPELKNEIHDFDCLYKLNDPVIFQKKKISVANFFKFLYNSGWEVGLHGSFLSYDSEKIFRKQKLALQEIIQSEVFSTRQHFLHYDIKKTPLVHHQAGIKVDSTIGFNRNIGFRAGTCMPYFSQDNEGNMLDVLEFPQIIMDVSLFSTSALELNAEKAIERSLKLMDKVEKVGGCLTINFHPNYLYKKDRMLVFETILQEAKSRNAYNATLKELYKIVKNQ